jgi:hypothetical protein
MTGEVVETAASFEARLRATTLPDRTTLAPSHAESLVRAAAKRCGVLGIDVSIADMFADDGAVLGLHQAVIAALSRPALGLFDEQLVEQFGDGLVDELRAVVGVEAQDAKGN